MATEDHRVSQPPAEYLNAHPPLGDAGPVADTAPVAEGPAAEAVPPERRRRRRYLWWALLAVVLLLLLIWLIFHLVHGEARKPAAPPPASIAVGRAQTGDINEYLYALGTVTPVYTVTIYSQITGRILAVHYQEGQMVRKGHALIDIDPRPYETTLAQAEGTLQRDSGSLAEARMDLTRYQQAYAKNAIARQQLEDQAQTVVQDEGTVKADQGTVDYDRVQLSYCHIVSPITGRVGLRLVDPGNTVFAGSGSTLVVVTQLQPITVVFDLSEDDVPQVQSQLSAGNKLRVDAFDRSDAQQIGTGTLTALDNEVDTTTGTVKFRARFPNQNLALFPNQFVNARLLLRTLHQATLVPLAAIQYNGTSPFLYVVQPNNTVAVKTVSILTSDDQNSAVQGVDPGVLVATSGFERIENGARVTYTAPAPAGNAQGTATATAPGSATAPGTATAPGSAAPATRSPP